MVSKKSKIIFLTPPKTASNSLKECLLDSSIKLEQFPKKYKYPRIHLFLSELVEIFDIKDLENYKVIQICRNPYERFVSLYYHNLRLTPKKHPLSSLSIQEFAEKFYECILEDDFIENFYSGKTGFFIDLIKAGKNWGGTRTFLNQTQWCDMEADIKYFKIEDITKSMESIGSYIGTYLPDMDKVNENETKIDYNSVLNKNIREVVKKINFDDFIKLGYEY